MRDLRVASIGCAFAVAASLLLARVHPFGNAGLYAAAPAPTATPAAILEHASVPPAVRATLVAKCADCHSMQPHTPFYGRFAPVSWLLERDILEGREKMNLSLWETYSADKQQTLEAKIVQETKSRDMPLLQYRMIHLNSRITDADVRNFSDWSRGAPVAGLGDVVGAAGEGDAARGKEVFEKRCTGCHAMERNREGPRLQGIYGRPSGNVSGFEYSPALKQAHVVWSDSTLDQWLADPDLLVPGNNMEFHVARPQERLDLIKFLKQGG